MGDIHTEKRVLSAFAERLLRYQAFKYIIDMWEECGATCFENELSELENELKDCDVIELRKLAESLIDVNEYLIDESELSDPEFYRGIIANEILRRAVEDFKMKLE